MDVPACHAYPWFALTVTPHHEKVVSTALSGKGYATFLPLYRGVHRSSGRMKAVDLPLFPTYLFCRFDPFRRLPILMTPGLRTIVSLGKTPAPVDHAEITSLQMMAASGLDPQPWPSIPESAPVLIAAGPLQGVTGRLLYWKNQARLVVSITLLQRSVAVEVDVSWVKHLDDGPACRLSVGA
jgi:transcription antitermination factor NusG